MIDLNSVRDTTLRSALENIALGFKLNDEKIHRRSCDGFARRVIQALTGDPLLKTETALKYIQHYENKKRVEVPVKEYSQL